MPKCSVPVLLLLFSLVCPLCPYIVCLAGAEAPWPHLQPALVGSFCFVSPLCSCAMCVSWVSVFLSIFIILDFGKSKRKVMRDAGWITTSTQLLGDDVEFHVGDIGSGSLMRPPIQR